MDILTKKRDKNGTNNKNKRVCQYGIDCYRKNPIHLDEFYHPHRKFLHRFYIITNNVVIYLYYSNLILIYINLSF